MDEKLAAGIQVPVCVGFDGVGIAAQLMDVWAAQRMVQQSNERAVVEHGLPRCSFVLEPMKADLTYWTGEILAGVDTLVRNNVWFSSLSVCVGDFIERWNHERPDEREIRNVLAKFSASAFSNTRRSPELATTRYHPELHATERGLPLSPLQLGQVYLSSCPDIDILDFAMVCSAIAVCQTTRKISFRMMMPAHNQDTEQWWKCIAYALFSKRAKAHSAVESLSLIEVESMGRTDMEAFTRVMTSQHPEEEVFGFPRGLINGRPATLKAGAPIRWPLREQDELDANYLETLVFETPVPLVRTLNDDGVSSWTTVIIPGYGPSQVLRADLIFHDDSDTSQPRQPGISSLTLSLARFGELDFGGMSLFLAGVGQSLKYLAINKRYKEGDELQILPHCPQIEELLLGWGAIDARLDFREYHRRNLPLPSLRASWHNAVALAHELCDASSSLAKSVRRLKIRLFQPDETSHNVTREALLEMLQKNQTLEYLQVIVPNEHDALSIQLKEQHLKPIWGVKKTLPIECRLAFVDIFSPHQMDLQGPKRKRSQSQSSIRLPELGETVLSSIFAYAAEPVLREVFVHTLKADHRREQLHHGDEPL